MSNIAIFICILLIISAVLLIMLILAHSPKGDGIAGIGNAAQMFSSQKSAEKGLNKIIELKNSLPPPASLEGGKE